VWRVSLVDEASEPLEPQGKLDTLEVNGPEGIDLNEDDVRRQGRGIGRACLSRVLGRRACAVLRGPRCSNAPGLPGGGCARPIMWPKHGTA
jgi:hypothetical protein